MLSAAAAAGDGKENEDRPTHGCRDVGAFARPRDNRDPGPGFRVEGGGCGVQGVGRGVRVQGSGFRL